MKVTHEVGGVRVGGWTEAVVGRLIGVSNSLRVINDCWSGRKNLCHNSFYASLRPFLSDQ